MIARDRVRVDTAALVAKVLARDARLLARVGSPEDNRAAMAIAKALQEPERVATLVAGIVELEPAEELVAAGM